MGKRHVLPPASHTDSSSIRDVPDSQMTVYRSGLPAAWAIRNQAHRRRHIYGPWITLTVLLASLLPLYLIHLIRPAAADAWLLLAPGVITAWAQSRKLQRREHKLYASTCIMLTDGWMFLALHCGLHGPGRWCIFMLAVPGIFPLAWLWWQFHQIRVEVAPEPEPEPVLPPADPVITAIEKHITAPGYPGEGIRISFIDEIGAGRRYMLSLVQGKMIHETAGRLIPHIASALGHLSIAENRLSMEPAVLATGDPAPHQAILTVLKPKPPTRMIQEFTGPTLIRDAGTIADGPYADGEMARIRLYKVDEHGRPMRTASGLWSGQQGSGKSRVLEHKITEHILSSLFVTLLIDGQGGASMPLLNEKVYWSAVTPDEWLRLLKAVIRLGIYRESKLARRGEGCWYATPEEPFIQIVIDEAQEVLKHPAIVRMIKTIIQRFEKVGIGVDVSTQQPVGNELGDSSGAFGASVIRNLLTNGNIGLFRTQDPFTQQITIGSDWKINPAQFPREPGYHLLRNDVATRGTLIRGIRVADLEQALRNAPRIVLPEDEDQAADGGTGDLFGRWDRYQEYLDNPLDPDEIALRLEEVMSGRSTRDLDSSSAQSPIVIADKPTAARLVLDIVRKAGHIKREEVHKQLQGVYSTSAIDTAFKNLCNTGATTNQVDRGFWSSAAYAAQLTASQARS